MSSILSLSDPGSTDAGVVGGKGANLGRLVAAGFPVPPGFVITASAYREFMRTTGSGQSVLERLQDVDYTDPDGLEAVTVQIRGDIADAEPPRSLVEEIRSAYAVLGGDAFVAVRSSGTAEDLEDA